MSEQYGLSLEGLGTGLFVCGMMIIPLGAIAVAIAAGQGPMFAMVIGATVLMAASFGVILSEVQILADEVRFSKECLADGELKSSRPRQWPHGNAALLYREGRGLWATCLRMPDAMAGTIAARTGFWSQ